MALNKLTTKQIQEILDKAPSNKKYVVRMKNGFTFIGDDERHYLAYSNFIHNVNDLANILSLRIEVAALQGIIREYRNESPK